MEVLPVSPLVKPYSSMAASLKVILLGSYYITVLLLPHVMVNQGNN